VAEMTLTRAIYIAESPFSQHDENVLGVSNLSKLGLEIEFWEVAPIFLPRSERQYVDPPQSGAVRRFTSMDSLCTECVALTEADIVFVLCGVYVHQLRSHVEMIHALGQSEAILVAISQGNLPHLRNRFRGRGPKDLMYAGLRLARRSSHLRRKISSRHSITLRTLDWIWAGVTVSSIDANLIGLNTKISYIHNLDYDRVLSLGTFKRSGCRTAIFLDHMGFSHPDIFTLGMKLSTNDEDSYFRAIRKAFDEFELESGLTVEIAGHPRAKVGSLERHYGGRRVRYQETAEAIAEASIILLSHASTAVGIAVALHCPLMVLHSKTFPREQMESTRILSRLLHVPIVDLECELKDWSIPIIDDLAYASYMLKYVKKTETPELPFWEIVADELKDNYNFESNGCS
jgi:hypothetical protein